LRGAIALLIVGTVILTLGAAALTVYAFRRRNRERFLVWFGLFSILYGAVLVTRNDAFRLGFGRPEGLGYLLERLISMLTIVPGLLLFEEFYGRGWRSSIRWLTGTYCVLVAVAIGGVLFQTPFDIALSPGIGLVIMVPIVLSVGRLAGYLPPPLASSRVLFAGLIAFYCAFAVDRLAHTRLNSWHSGVEPYGFLILVLCLGYVTSQRVIADERRLVSLTDEMRAAKRIQDAILPRQIPSLENIHIAVRYAAMTAVAGDLYAFPTVHPDGIGVLVADVKGHGVPAALIASMVKVAVSTRVEDERVPASMMTGLNNTLCREAPEQFVTAVYFYLDAVNMVGRYSAAGHPPGLLWRRNRQVLELLAEPGLLLGVRPNESYTQSKVSLEGGDRLLLYTDGLTEAENTVEKSFGEAALPTFIEEKQNLGTEQFADHLLEEVLTWSRDGRRKGQEDDITIMVIDIM
jgi:sigma-B regulation protein RsbU (phosphoserine phosphatase)